MCSSMTKILAPTSEHSEQVRIFQWAKLMEIKHPELKYMFSTLNGVRLSIGAAKKAKASGNKSGVCDIIWPYKVKEYSGLMIELKVTKKKSVVSPNQRDFIKFTSSQGYCSRVCYGADEAINLIRDYIQGEA